MAIVFRRTKGENLYQPKLAQEVPAFTRDTWGPEVETCSFCGAPQAAGWWHGEQRVSVCRTCAVQTLPRLMADALVGEREDFRHVYASLYRELLEAERHFWMAACGAIALAAQRVQERGEQ
jgi:hypothetical protein